jgi:hypothetical protein
MELPQVKEAIQNYMEERFGFDPDHWSWTDIPGEMYSLGLITHQDVMFTIRASKSGHFAWYKFEDCMKVDRTGKVIPQ